MRAAALLLFLALLSPLAESAAPKRVLILHSFGRDFAPFNAIAPALRTELARQLKQPVAFYEASLDTERIGPPGDEHALVDFLRSHHGTTQPDLVVVLAASALRFYLRHRERLFPDAPLLVTGIAERRLQDIQLGSRDRVVSVNSDIRVIANNILKVLPETGTLAVVQGSSRIDRLERVEFQSQLALVRSNELTSSWPVIARTTIPGVLAAGDEAWRCRRVAAGLGWAVWLCQRRRDGTGRPRTAVDPARRPHRVRGRHAGVGGGSGERARRTRSAGC